MGRPASPETARPAALPFWQRWRVVLLAAFLAVALAVGLAELTHVARAYRRAEGAALLNQAENAVTLASATALFVARYTAMAETAARAIFEPPLAGDARQWILATIQRTHPEVSVVAAIDPNGRVISADPAAAVGIDVADRGYFRQIAGGASTAVSDLQIGRLYRDQLSVAIAAGWRGPEGALRGIVAIALPVTTLQRELGLELSGDARALLVDRTGRAMLYDSRRTLGWAERDFSRIPLVAAALAGRPVQMSEFTVPPDRQPMLGAMVPVARLGWAVGAVQPVETALAPARQELRLALATSAFILGLGVALALLLSGFLSQPIAALTAGVAAITRGDLGYRVRVRGRHELRQLADHFNLMAARLEGARTQERALRDELQAKAAQLEENLEELEAARRRSAFLADVSKRLAVSLEYEETLATVARLAVDGFADYCIVYLVDPDQSIRRAAIAHRDPAQEAIARALQHHPPPDPGGPHPVAKVLRTGRPELVPDVGEEWLATATHSHEHREIVRKLGPTSFLVVPLVARGRVLGAISFALATPGRRHGPADLAMAEDLARRAAVAVDNARLYREAQEAIRARDDFLARASHELRTPLTIIKGHLTLMSRRQASLDAEAERLVRIALRHADQMTRLLTDLLDASRLAAGRLALDLEPLELGAVAAEGLAQAAPLAAEKGLVLVNAVEPGLSLLGDRLKLEQMLVNLLTNAIKHTPAGGTIRVEGAASGREAELRVRDTGAGIPREHLERIFEPFFQVGSASGRRKAAGQGAGLGLAIVRRLVELHGGRIWAESEGPGRGSTFVVRLPVAPAEDRAA